MSRYTETTYYDLRKPIPNSELTKDTWGNDINRNIINIDKYSNDIKVQAELTKSLADEAESGLVVELENALISVSDRITSLTNRLEPYLDNPDCDAQAQVYLGQLQDLNTWVDERISFLQTYNADGFITQNITVYKQHVPSSTFTLNYSNGLLQSTS